MNYLSSEQAKEEFEKLFHNVLEKYKLIHFESIIEKTYYEFVYKNSKNRFLMLYVEPYEFALSLLVGDIVQSERKNVKYLIQAMREKGADISRVREKLKKKKFEKDEWFKDSIEREILFVEEFGDLVL